MGDAARALGPAATVGTAAAGPAAAARAGSTAAVTVQEAVSAAFQEEWGRIVATLIRTTGDWDTAEECAQDAFALALASWPRQGIPRRPGAWLTTVARNRAVDRVRRASAGAAKLQEVALSSDRGGWGGGLGDFGGGNGDGDGDGDESGISDDRLRLMFTCCHPALALDAQVALTLRTLAGLTTSEIARAFLVPEPPWRNGWCGPSARFATPVSPSASRRPTCCRSEPARCWRCCTCCSTRGTRPPRAPSWFGPGCAPRRSA